MTADRELMKIVVVGHVDHGKSTVIGRLLYDTHSLPLGAIEKVKRISEEKGKPFEYAYLLDAFEEEQKQGITIDITQLQFRTEWRDYVIIDAPGHKEFLKNMISGAAAAEAALLIIDAGEGVQEQSKRHGYLLSLLGIKKVYVLVNKMDLRGYAETAFLAIKEEMSAFLDSIGVHPLRYIPVSAFYGENIAATSAVMDWYHGPTVLAALDLFVKEEAADTGPLRFPIQDVYKFDNRRIIAGRIESGNLRIGDKIVILPEKKLTHVKSIEQWPEPGTRETASVGMSVGITVTDEFYNRRGEVIAGPESIPHTGKLFRANIFWLGRQPLTGHREYKLKLATQETSCVLQSIDKVIDAATLAHQEQTEAININDVAEVVIRCRETLCFDRFADNHALGRFVLLDGYDVCGGGIIAGAVREGLATSVFVQESLEVPIYCFDDYYFAWGEGKVKKVQLAPQIFVPGDKVPVAGITYHYPDNFHVVVPETGLLATIISGEFAALEPLADFVCDGLPLVDVNGALIEVKSQEELEIFRLELASFALAEAAAQEFFLTKWLSFTKYRSIPYVTVSAGESEYQI